MTISYTIWSCSPTILSALYTDWLSLYYNVVISVTQYPGQNPFVFSDYYNITTSALLYSAITFPGLIVTELTPGEVLTIVRSHTVNILTTRIGMKAVPPILTRMFRRVVTSNALRILVPTDAITASITSTTADFIPVTSNTAVGTYSPTVYSFIPKTGGAVTTNSPSGSPSAARFEFRPIWCCLLIVLLTSMLTLLG